MGPGACPWATGTAAGTAPETTLRARSGTLQVPSLSQDPQNAASWPIRAELGHIYCKVSQNG